MSKLADNEEELVLEDQTISPGSPRVNPKDLDEVVQLLVTVEIEDGGNVSEDVEKTTEVEAALVGWPKTSKMLPSSSPQILRFFHS